MYRRLGQVVGGHPGFDSEGHVQANAQRVGPLGLVAHVHHRAEWFGGAPEDVAVQVYGSFAQAGRDGGC